MTSSHRRLNFNIYERIRDVALIQVNNFTVIEADSLPFYFIVGVADVFLEKAGITGRFQDLFSLTKIALANDKIKELFQHWILQINPCFLLQRLERIANVPLSQMF